MLMDILREAGIKKMPSVCPRSLWAPFSVISTAISVLCTQFEEHHLHGQIVLIVFGVKYFFRDL